jgi:EAL domain-containing protein (putative c-di-GMP-specific phosphodiesterase class I)
VGCDKCQGYLIARPMNAEDATAYLRSRLASRETAIRIPA